MSFCWLLAHTEVRNHDAHEGFSATTWTTTDDPPVINLVSHRVVKADRTGSNSMSFARLCFQSFYSQCGHLKSCIQVFRSPIYLYRKNTKIQIRSRTSWGIYYTFVFIILYLSRWDLNLISKKGLANRAAKATANTTHNNITSKKQILYCIQTSEHKRVNNTK